MTASIVFHLLAALAYAVPGYLLWRPFVLAPAVSGAGEGAACASLAPSCRYALAAAIALHGLGLAYAIIVADGLFLGWALALSVAMWLGMAVFWLESYLLRLDGLLLLLLPAAAVVCLIAALFPQGYVIAHAASELLRIHLLIAMIAYGLITVAALHAILMAALDRQLHQPVAVTRGRLARALQSMPPLLTLEQLLFKLIGIGFIMLSLTVLTGIFVSLVLSGALMPLDHKSIFTLLSWITFGVLLAGRVSRGWRGRTALRWTMAGFAFLLLAYTGSRFVMEVILHR